MLEAFIENLSQRVNFFEIALSLSTSLFVNKNLKEHLELFLSLQFYRLFSNITGPWFPQHKDVKLLYVPWDNLIK